MVRLGRTIAACGLARRPFVRLIEANRLDQRKSRYATWQELRGLLHAVGRSGGRDRARRLRPRRPRVDRAVRPDLHGAAARRALPGRGRGPRSRARLPAARRTLPASAAPSRSWVESTPAGRCGPCWRSRSRRAGGCSSEGLPLIAQLRGRPRLAVASFVAGGRAALDAIERADYDVLAGAPRAGDACAACSRWPRTLSASRGTAPVSDARSTRGLRALRGDHARAGRELLLRHPPALRRSGAARCARSMRSRAASTTSATARSLRRREAASCWPSRTGRSPSWRVPPARSPPWTR